MASPQKSSKPATSRWNFLSQAVNAVESRLDTILADEEEGLKKVQNTKPVTKENASPAAPRVSAESPRSSTSTPANDRLQQRLAQAMAKKNAARLESPITASEPVSRTATPIVTEPRTSLQVDDAIEPTGLGVQYESNESSLVVGESNPSSARPSHEQSTTLNIPVVVDSTSQSISVDAARSSQEEFIRFSTDDPDAALLQAQLEHEDEKSKLREEIQGYIERIDALSSKLQYLAKEAARSAKEATNRDDLGSTEKKLLEKEEKIALLMEEGQKLSVNEMKNLTIIKRLRSQMATNTKDQDAIRRRAEKAERQLTTLDEKAKRAEEAVRKVESQTMTLSKTTQDLEAVIRERNALNATLTEMKAQVAKANTRAENAESRATTEKLDLERKKNAELQDDITSAKLERQLAEEKLRKEIKDLQSSLEREKEQSRAMETEMLAEQATLESKLETFRVRAEEASSNDQGDSQAKLLRQIETLQSQYAAASQNWQGIEGTLLTRITALEKERDEVTLRETDVRKKLRDATLKFKSHERAFEEGQLKLTSLQDSQTDYQTETDRMSRRTQQLEEELYRAQKETEDQKVRLEKEYTRKLEEERSKWTASIERVRTESPNYSTRKSSAYDIDRLTSPVQMDRPLSRKSSALVSVVSGTDGPARQYSTSHLRGHPNGTIIETPSVVASMSADQDDYFAKTPATPGSENNVHSRRGFNDLISTSTVGAGPSVQLVERMSANVRRLESEKAASKDELARLTTQRDESRSEVVRLMREVEQKRKIEERLKRIEEEHKGLNERHQTTLEMLGEKSEQVEELKQDVMDVKQMYRDLANHMK